MQLGGSTGRFPSEVTGVEDIQSAGLIVIALLGCHMEKGNSKRPHPHPEFVKLDPSRVFKTVRHRTIHQATHT